MSKPSILHPVRPKPTRPFGRAMTWSFVRRGGGLSEYKRALGNRSNSKAHRRSLADLNRAFGKTEEALALYRQQLVYRSKRQSCTGRVWCFRCSTSVIRGGSESGLDKALQSDPRNLLLLAGAAYWFAAHNDGESALALANKA